MDLREGRPAAVDRHPWELARVAALRRIAARYRLLNGPDLRVLDIGCGDGFLIDALTEEAGATVDAIDSNLTPERRAELAALHPRLSFHAGYQEVAGRRYHLLTLFDVLEHLADDHAFLQETMAGFARPGGLLFCTVPAFPALFCGHDVFLRHHRRYHRPGLRRLLAQAGLRELGSGYLFGSLLPCRALETLRERLLGASHAPAGLGAWRHGPHLSQVIKRLLEYDNRLLLALNGLGVNLPGLTVWAVCQIP